MTDPTDAAAIMDDANDRAAVLVEALPYIQRFRGTTVVVKFGGNAMADPATTERLAEDLVLMRAVGMHPILVHGGGPQIGELMDRLGKAQGVNAKIRESAASMMRMLIYAGGAETLESPAAREHISSLQHDLASVTDHSGYLSGNITFLLDAALGLINIEQNGIIKFFSVAAVVLMPPTLVASIYGMNFHHMPELAWPYGYPMALSLMAISAILPFLWFRRRGWF